MFLKILEKIKEFDSIILHRHERPDGDCIGTQMGFYHLIKANFPNKCVYTTGDELPDYLARYGHVDNVTDEMYENALVIVVDTATEKRICDKRYNTGKYLIKIDHHDDSPEYGDLCYIDNTSPACASIIVDMYKAWHAYDESIVLSTPAATSLMLGMVTDTGRFRYRGTSRKTLENAGLLLDAGVELDELYASLYTKEKEELKLQGYVCENFKVTNNGVAYIYFDQETMDKYNVDKDTAAACVNILDSIKGSLIWATFIEQNNEAGEIRVRLRSRFVSINEVATHYRGGGHLQAAGATVYNSEEKEALLLELDELLKEFKANNPERY